MVVVNRASPSKRKLDESSGSTGGSPSKHKQLMITVGIAEDVDAEGHRFMALIFVLGCVRTLKSLMEAVFSEDVVYWANAAGDFKSGVMESCRWLEGRIFSLSYAKGYGGQRPPLKDWQVSHAVYGNKAGFCQLHCPNDVKVLVDKFISEATSPRSRCAVQFADSFKVYLPTPESPYADFSIPTNFLGEIILVVDDPDDVHAVAVDGKSKYFFRSYVQRFYQERCTEPEGRFCLWFPRESWGYNPELRRTILPVNDELVEDLKDILQETGLDVGIAMNVTD